MRSITAFFIVVAPWIVCLIDSLVLLNSGPSATITGVVRSWAADSKWPEAIYLAGVILLYFHLFRWQ